MLFGALLWIAWAISLAYGQGDSERSDPEPSMSERADSQPAAAEAADPAFLQPDASGEEPPVVPGTEALELGDPAASTHCLLVHGFAGSRKDFADLGQLLADAGLHVRLVRLPGHGTTPQDMGEHSAEELIEAVRQELRASKARFQTVYLVGFSMGGALSTIVAAEEGVDRLLLLAPCYAVTPHWYYMLRPETWNRLLSPMVRYVPKAERTVQVNRREAVPHLFSYRKIPTSAVTVLGELGRRASQAEVLGAIQAPVLVLHSPGDNAASPRASMLAFQLLGSDDKRYVAIPKRNNHHLLWDWDREQVKQQALEFLLSADEEGEEH